MRKIWIVDDDDTYVFICKCLFQRAGKDVQLSVLDSGLKAVTQIKKLKDKPHELPEIIFLDLNMPYIDGWNFIDLFKVYKKNIKKDIQIIILSSSIDQEDQKKAANCAEVKEYIVKPLTLSHITKLLYPISGDKD